MKYNNILALACFATFFVACNNDDDDQPTPTPTAVTPEACIEVNQSVAGIENFAFAFTNCSQNATRLEWDFGDGNTSTIQNPTHVYEEYGTYEVTLTAYNGTAFSTKKITVNYGYYSVQSFSYQIVSQDQDASSFGPACTFDGTPIVTVDAMNGTVCADGSNPESSCTLEISDFHVIGLLTSLEVNGRVGCLNPPGPGGTPTYSTFPYLGETTLDLSQSMEYTDIEFTSAYGGKILVSIRFKLNT